MLQIRLSDADRERYGCEEWLDADAASVSVREAMALQPLGFTSPTDWRQALRGDVVEEDGKPVLRPDGQPLRRQGRQYPAALLGLVWLALKRSGVQVGLDDLDFDMDNLDIEAPPEPEQADEPGKDPSTPTPISEP